jgi:serine O-acetyltransferase
MTARAALRVDLERYLPGAPPWAVPVRLRAAITHPQMWILALFRFGVYLRSEAPPMVALLMTPLWRVASAVLHTVFDIHIGAAAQIGPGLYLGHVGGIWINAGATLGASCNVSQGVVIGAAGGVGLPVIGDRVWLGPHAVVTGPVRVGNDAVVGANSLVATDVPACGVAVGVPAKVIAHSGSSHVVHVPPSLRDG